MFVEDIKRAARISHDSLDSELTRLEGYASAELVRAGVPSDQIIETNELVKNAVITRVLMDLADDKNYERYKDSWENQLDNIRKHEWVSP